VTQRLLLPGVSTSVLARAADGTAVSVLAGAAGKDDNFLDLVDASLFERDDIIALDQDTAAEEYFQVRFVDGNRLWFSSTNSSEPATGLRFDHAAGALVLEVILLEGTEGVHYSLNAITGKITELQELGTGVAIVVSYTTDFVVPGSYPPALNNSPDLDESTGDWTGKDLVDGTYQVGIWGHQEATFSMFGEDSEYIISSTSATQDVLVGFATTLEPYDLISSAENCYSCHQDILFHDERDRGFETCLLCHGTAGAEDLPRSVAASAPETSGVSVSFRTLLHRIHRGKTLANAAGFTTVGAGDDPYPDNFSLNTYEQIAFPAMPGATKHCAKCHGDTNTAWMTPADRDHPTQQILPTQTWTNVCIGCHDASAAVAHMQSQTSPFGAEACAICHDQGEEYAVELVHETR
jgi:OmcA/MtrC family decaheme c-type cytochrome